VPTSGLIAANRGRRVTGPAARLALAIYLIVSGTDPPSDLITLDG
jgi:hypothetical protein